MLQLANGKTILPDGTVTRTVTVPQPSAQFSREIVSGRAASATLERIHRKLGDLPDEPVKMNPIAAVISYTAIGLSDADIATSLGATEAQIKTIKDSEAYKLFAEMFDKTVFEDARRNAKHIVAKASDKAAQTMVDLLDSSDESIKAVASRELLKTAGVSLDESSNKLSGGLKIVIERAGQHNDDLKISIGGTNG